MILASPMLYYQAKWRVSMRVAPEIVLTDDERAELTRLARSKRTSVRLSLRARIVLLCAAGMQNKEIAEQLDVGRVQVARWRERSRRSGPASSTAPSSACGAAAARSKWLARRSSALVDDH